MLWLLFSLMWYGYPPPIDLYPVPATNMSDTLLEGDLLVGSTEVYANDSNRAGGDPQRGDIAIFRSPSDDRSFFISRVIGLPGDRIRMVDGGVVINGEPVPRELLGGQPIVEAPPDARRYVETLPNGVSYETLDFDEDGFLDNTDEFEVPAGSYFVLGDNRDNSVDSRISEVGFVARERFLARPGAILLSISPETGELRTDRFFRAIK